LTIVFPNFTALGRMAVSYVSKLDAIATKKVQDDFGETEHVRNKAITKIRQWYQTQPHLNHFELDDHTLLCFIRGSEYELETAKDKIETMMKMRASLPVFFTDWNPFKPELQAILKLGTFLPLLEYDSLGRKVIIKREGCFDPYLHKVEDVEKVNFMITELLGSVEEQMFVTGMVVIIDLEGCSLNHITQRSLSLTRKQMKYLLNAFPLDPKSLNFISMPSVLRTAYHIITGFLPDKIQKRLKIHENMDSLHNAISPNILPKEYGGNGLSLVELTGNLMK